MNKTFADRLATAMKLKGIKTASALSRETGIERSYMYRLASGKIDNPAQICGTAGGGHWCLQPLAEHGGGGSLRPGTGETQRAGSKCDHAHPCNRCTTGRGLV